MDENHSHSSSKKVIFVADMGQQRVLETGQNSREYLTGGFLSLTGISATWFLIAKAQESL